MQETSDNITVLIRIRPLNEQEKQEGAYHCFRVDENNKNTIIFDSNFKGESKYFTFDYVCNENSTQEEVFQTIGAPIANFSLKGKHIFKLL